MSPLQKSFEGPDPKVLLDQIRREVGPDAKINGAERIRVGGVMGFFAKESYRVVVETNGGAGALQPIATAGRQPAHARPKGRGRKRATALPGRHDDAHGRAPPLRAHGARAGGAHRRRGHVHQPGRRHLRRERHRRRARDEADVQTPRHPRPRPRSNVRVRATPRLLRHRAVPDRLHPRRAPGGGALHRLLGDPGRFRRVGRRVAPWTPVAMDAGAMDARDHLHRGGRRRDHLHP